MDSAGQRANRDCTRSTLRLTMVRDDELAELLLLIRPPPPGHDLPYGPAGVQAGGQPMVVTVARLVNVAVPAVVLTETWIEYWCVPLSVA